MLHFLRRCVAQDSWLRLFYHKVWAVLGNLIYRFPAKSLVCIGVTGTDGKTTTVQILTHILDQCGYKVGMTSTQGFQIGKQKLQNTTHKTTLGRIGLPRMLRSIVDAGCTHAVIEVSSHALQQHRTWGIPFVRGIATNVSREHLDYHKTMEAYTQAKSMLFRAVRRQDGVAILNSDDAAMGSFADVGPDTVLWYGIEKEENGYMARNITNTPQGTKWTLVCGPTAYEVTMSLVGQGNVYNALAAIACADSLAIAPADAIAALATFAGVPGRMETMTLPVGAHVIIDYAVTPKALEQLYKTVRTCTTGKVIAVLGACGDRDQGKRPEMGKLAASLTDHVVLTDEEPYTEDPMAIIAMLETGVQEAGKRKEEEYVIYPEREAGIRYALMRAQAGDTVVISGMGDQDSRIVGSKKIPWSDRGVVQAYCTEQTE